MNKTVNINLAGIFFHIDEDAYQKLQHYLDAIKRSFRGTQGGDEILSDIEARIAELFDERVLNEKQVVSISLVDEIISIMGQPEDYAVDEEIFEDETETSSFQKQSKSNSTNNKKLFRDSDSSYVAGVASGIAYYLGVDVQWVRLAWILAAFFTGGSVILVYVLFWVLVPEAKSTSEKLMMTGEPINISNIEKKIKDGLETVGEAVKNIDFQEQSEKIKKGFEEVSDSISDAAKKIKTDNDFQSKSQNFFDALGNIVNTIFRVFGKFIGVILIFTGIAALISLIIGLFSFKFTNVVDVPGINIFGLGNSSRTSLLTFLVAGIPVFSIVYLGLKILVSNLKPLTRGSKLSLLGIWILSIIGLSTTGFKESMKFKTENKHIQTKTFNNLTVNDTIFIKMNDDNPFSNYKRDFDFEHISTDNNEDIFASKGIRLVLKSTKDKVAKIKVEKYARGKDYAEARKNAEAITYNYSVANKTIDLDSYITVNEKDLDKKQKIKVTIYVPIGSVIYANENTYYYHRNESRYGDILDNGYEEHYMRVKRNDLECLDCNDENKNETDETEDDNDGININLNFNDDNGSQIKIDKNGIDIQTPEKNITIDENGVKTTTDKVKVDIDENGINIDSENNKDN